MKSGRRDPRRRVPPAGRRRRAMSHAGLGTMRWGAPMIDAGHPPTTTRGRRVGRPRPAADGHAAGDRPRRPRPRRSGSARSWLSRRHPPALVLPFVVGGLIAYQLLPVVDALDRVHAARPRRAARGRRRGRASDRGRCVIVLPPLAHAFVRLAVDLPTPADIDAAIARSPGPARDAAGGIGGRRRPGRDDARDGGPGRAPRRVRRPRRHRPGRRSRALLNAVGALLGLIVLPTWMLIGDEPASSGRASRSTAGSRRGLRPDLWAVVAIVDRAAGAYLRGYVVTGVLVGFLTYVPRRRPRRRGSAARPFGEPLALATFAGVTQVVPVIGPLLGAAARRC